MRGRNPLHEGTGLVAAPSNSVAVIKGVGGGSAGVVVGADGTLYMGSIFDSFAHALNADGTHKWTFDVGHTVIASSPAVGADGTVYLAATDGYLFALRADGTLKWNHRWDSSGLSHPALGADGTVYVGNGNGSLYAVKGDDGTLKWTYQTGDRICSAPAVDDGTVYAGSTDGYLYALQADDSTLKWKYKATGDACSSPAVGADGSVYVGSSDGLLHALDVEGTVRWTYPTGDRVSSPAVDADGNVYVGSYDGYLYALEANGTLKWTYGYQPTPYAAGSPAVGSDGTVYVGLSGEIGDSKLHALDADGKLKWLYKVKEDIVSSPALGADGTVIVNSPNGNLYAFGLSAAYVTSSLHLAQRRMARNESAVPQLQHLCAFTSETLWAPQCNATHGCNVCGACCNTYLLPSQCAACHAQNCPPRADTFTHETTELVNTSCQLLHNYNASAPFLTAWEGYLDSSLSFAYYKERISDGGTLLVLLQQYEALHQHFIDRDTTLQDRLDDAQTAVDSLRADEDSWRARMQSDKIAMGAYCEEVVVLGQQMDAKFALLQGDVHGLIDSLNEQLDRLSLQLQKAKHEYEVKQAMGLFGAIVQVVRAVVAVGSCFASSTATAGAALLACGKDNMRSISSAIESVKGCVHTFSTGCQPCKALAAEMKEAQEAEEDIDRLSNMAKAAQALNDQLSEGAPLPQELPILISDKIAIDSLRRSADALKQELVKTVGSQGQQLLGDIQDWADMGVTRVSLFLSYYNKATRVQNDNSSLRALQVRTALVTEQLQNEHTQAAAVTTAAQLIEEKKQLQTDLVLKYMYEEWKQYHFYSLMPLAPLTGLPAAPTSADLLEKQTRIEANYEAEIERQAHAGKSAGWIYIVINASAEPHTIAALAATGATQVVLPIPLKNVTDPMTNTASLIADTRYTNVRLFDVGVYPLDAQGHVIGGARSVEVIVAKGGASWFFDSDKHLHTFSHEPVKYGAGGDFSYHVDATGKACPVNYRACVDTLCPNYISFSPYGKWDVRVPDGQGIDLSRLNAIRFEFSVTYEEDQSFTGFDWFGKHYPTYLQDKGGGPPQRGCLHTEEGLTPMASIN